MSSSSSAAACPCPPADWREEAPPHPADVAGLVRAGAADELECPCPLCVVRNAEGKVTDIFYQNQAGGRVRVEECASSSSARPASSASASSISIPSLGTGSLSSSSKSQVLFQCCEEVVTRMATRRYLTITEVNRSITNPLASCPKDLLIGTYPMDYQGMHPAVNMPFSPDPPKLLHSWDYVGTMAGNPSIPLALCAQVECSTLFHPFDANCIEYKALHPDGFGTGTIRCRVTPTWVRNLGYTPGAFCLHSDKVGSTGYSENIVCCSDEPPVFWLKYQGDFSAGSPYHMYMVLDGFGQLHCCTTTNLAYSNDVTPEWVFSD